ncbi:MAG: DUF169 domain-containing protein [Chloroflexi bacterium]|nr:DUF169 domain-containing protein [Chloroflexota bacterium]
MGYQELTELLMERIEIAWPPVALAFVLEPPLGVPPMGKESPSFCTFWRWGERSLFYASARQHLGCPIGALVAGFPLPEEALRELPGLMNEMCEGEQTAIDDEIARTPRVAKPATAIVYGPLWRFPLEPDLVLIWANMVQMAVLQEISGAILWRGRPEGAVFTRPACSALAIALERQRPVLSLGCAGMRSYTAVPSDLFPLAFPGAGLPRLEEALGGREDAPQRLQFYLEKLRAGLA